MKIEILLKREPFQEIFEKTLQSFLINWSGHAHVVKWEPREVLNSSVEPQQLWHCNPWINSVFVDGVKPFVFESINGEYGHNPMAPWRSGFQKLYLILSQSKLLGAKLAKYKITISPPIGSADNKLIIGGNTKLRLIDLAKKEVYVLLKDGFDEKYLREEIFVRQKFPYMPIPKIIEMGSNNKWYSEEYVVGKPPNRFYQVFGDKILLKAVSDVHQMLHDTKKVVVLSEYVAILEKEIYEEVDQISHIDINVANDLKSIARSLGGALEKSKNQTVTLAHCHGDFHQGNVLANDHEYWILDWEYSGVKQIAYDLLILLLESRIENGFASRFLKIVNNELGEFQLKLANDWPEVDWNHLDSKYRYLMVFLLEDLLFYIQENGNRLFYGKNDVLKNRCKEIKKIVSALVQSPIMEIG